MTARNAVIAPPGRARVWISFSLALLLMASFFTAVIGPQSVSAQSADETLAASVPADTVIYLDMDLDQESEQWTQSFALFERAGLNDLAEQEVGASTEELGDSAESMNFTGEAAIVFTDAEALMSSASSTDFATSAVSDPMATADEAMTESAEVPAGFAMVFQPTDTEALAAQFEESVNSEAEANGATVQTVEYNGATITYWESTDPAIAATATTVVNDTVIMGTMPSDLEPIIDTVNGDTESLASTDGFTSVYDKLETNSLFYGYVNLDAMLTAVQNSEAYAEMEGAEDMMAELDAAKGHAGWSLYASEVGFHTDSVVVPADPASIPAAGEFTPSMAGKFPADVMMFSNANNLYGTGISDLLASLMQASMAQSGSSDMESTTPVATPTVDETWAMFEQMLGFNPDTDLLQKLDGEYAVYAGVYDLESGMPTPEFLFVSGTSDAATLEQTSATITELLTQSAQSEGAEVEITSRTVEGGELTVINFPAETTGMVPVTIEYGVVNDELLIGANGAIDKYLAGDAPVLADDENFQAAFAELPSENVISVSYLNIEGQVLPLLDFVTMMMASSSSSMDNHEDCANYATQAEAQTAYDADPGELWLLDMDADGDACEDFFGEATAQASPELVSEQVNVDSAAAVTWTDGEAMYFSSIVVIGD